MDNGLSMQILFGRGGRIYFPFSQWKESEGQVPVHEDGHGVYWVGREAFSFSLNSLISFAAFFTKP